MKGSDLPTGERGEAIENYVIFICKFIFQWTVMYLIGSIELATEDIDFAGPFSEVTNCSKLPA
jgi:hypothetical protein